MTKHILKYIKTFILSDVFLGLLLLGVFLMTNGYTFGWDDQHLEIPLLKKLIDPALYPGDYYVEALKANFISYLYPILAKIISISQIPNVYFFLYLISRYIMLTFMFKLWKTLTKDRVTSFLCVMMFLVLGRVEEFLYRTFSHQEFALGIIFIGLFAFYRNRFLLASAILGIAANFHALYSGFPFAYLAGYLLWQNKNYGFSKFFKACATFLLCASPILIWIIKAHFIGSKSNIPTEQWLDLYELACPQNHPFLTGYLSNITVNLKALYTAIAPYLLLAAAWITNGLFNETFKQDKKTQTILTIATLFVAGAFIFSYIIPVKFFVDLNLVRNTQYMLFFLMGHTVILIRQKVKKGETISACLCALFLGVFRYSLTHAILAILAIGAISSLSTHHNKKSFHRSIQIAVSILILAASTIAIFRLFMLASYARSAWLTLIISEATIVAAFLSCYLVRNKNNAAKCFSMTALIIPFVAMTTSFTFYHKQRLAIEKNGGGFWQLQRNWIDMQNFVRKNTPQDAVILVPHDMEMGGFRIRSERTIVMSYRDCGVIGFDYEAGREWQNRLNDIGAFQVIIEKPLELESAIKNAVIDYHADYIVFMNYMAPQPSSGFKLIYRNDIFSLFHIIK